LQNNTEMTDIAHLPISASAFQNSVIELEKQLKNTQLTSEGYYEWKQAHEAGKAGVFEIEVKDIIKFIEGSINNS
jgi:hypothetical protein